MQQLNVRNIDDALWREVKQRAVQAGVSVGELLNRILAEWLEGHKNLPPADARERARRGRGMLAHLASGTSFTDELHRMRREDFEREERR